MRSRWWVSLIAVLIFAVPAADAFAGRGGSSSSGGSKSSGGSSSSKSSGSDSSGSSSSAPKATGSARQANPSSNTAVRQPTSVHLIPRQFQSRKSLPPKARKAMKKGRKIAADKEALEARPGRFLDPYSPRYYGRRSSAFFYLWLAARDDDDPEDPLRPQRCTDWNEEEEYCEDFVSESSSTCGGTGMIPVFMLGLIGAGYTRRRVRGQRALR